MLQTSQRLVTIRVQGAYALVACVVAYLEIAELLRWRNEAAADIGISEEAEIHGARPAHALTFLIKS
jgi:hypothetical protein